MTRSVITILVCLAAAGCGESTLDAEDVSSDVRKGYEQETSLQLDELDCGETDAEVGAQFRCTGRNSSGVDLTIGGEVKSVDGSRAKYDWKVVDAVAPGTIFADAAKRQLEQRVGQEAKAMTCPERVRIRANTTVRCELSTIDGKRFGATLKLTDDKGAFDVQVDPREQRP